MGDAVGAGAAMAIKATPGPAGIVSLDPQADPLSFLGGLVRDYGDVVRYSTKFGPCFLFVHPAQVETILHSTKTIVAASLREVDAGGWAAGHSMDRALAVAYG